jgi:signal transduction histidine kinase
VVVDTKRVQSYVFFVEYTLVLLFGTVWVQFPHVRARMSAGPDSFYLLLAVAFCYLGLRAYLQLVRGFSGGWEYVWLTVDLTVITGAVYLTGGIRSEAALMYFWPIATSAIERKLARTIGVGVAGAVLYGVATWSAGLGADGMGWLGTRLFLFAIVTSLAACFAGAEARRVEELARLREKVAVAEYRTRLSQEMHDGIQHYLVNISTHLEMARALLHEAPGRAAEIAIQQRITVRQAADELRYLIRRLRSPVLEREGFVEAVREHCTRFAERSSIAVPVHVESAITLPPDVEQAAFRIVQEALTNAEKHAGATEVRVSLRLTPGYVEGLVADNGAGFDPTASPPEGKLGRGFGLDSMRERADGLGGRVQVLSEPGRGTTVAFAFPVPETAAASAREEAHARHQAADR